jgi:hypothetical protein
LPVSEAHAEDADEGEEVEGVSVPGGDFGEEHCKQREEMVVVEVDNREKVNKRMLPAGNTDAVDTRR